MHSSNLPVSSTKFIVINKSKSYGSRNKNLLSAWCSQFKCFKSSDLGLRHFLFYFFFINRFPKACWLMSDSALIHSKIQPFGSCSCNFWKYQKSNFFLLLDYLNVMKIICSNWGELCGHSPQRCIRCVPQLVSISATTFVFRYWQPQTLFHAIFIYRCKGWFDSERVQMWFAHL